MVQHQKDPAAKWLALIGQTIAGARNNLRLSVRELAKMTGISASHILRIESGEFDFTVSKLLVLAEALGLPVGVLSENALFQTRDFSGEFWGNCRREKQFQKLVGDDSRKDDDLLELLTALARIVAALVLSTNPPALCRLVELPFSEVQERLADFSTRVDVNATQMDRAYTLIALTSRPLGKLKGLGLVDDDLIERYLNWAKSNDLTPSSLDWVGLILDVKIAAVERPSRFKRVKAVKR